MKNKTLLHSFRNAFNGICQAFLSERNMKVHTIVTSLMLVLGLLFHLDTARWIALFLVIGLVIVCELLNTSIEKLTDMVTSEYSEEARKVKDISAAAVLVSSILSVVVGLFIFYQPVINWLQ